MANVRYIHLGMTSAKTFAPVGLGADTAKQAAPRTNYRALAGRCAR
jgi:hypothetical protein